MSVQLDISRLRSALRSQDVSSINTQYICDDAENQINQSLLSIVSDAVSEAIDHALSIGADGFIDDVQVVADADGLYQISTHSGTLDYSKPEQHMLSSLLKNAKISKDGHRYKVIPIKQKDTQVEQSMFSMMQNRQDTMDDSRNALREAATNRKLALTEALGVNISKQVSFANTVKTNKHAKTGATEFRTATDRQDASSAWVIPEKEADMSEYIQVLNRQITDQALSAIASVMDSFYSQYVGE